MTDLVRFSLEGAVARLHFDDGKANVISPASLAALNAALDRAEKEAGAALLFGRSGRFCAGFDLNTIQQSPEAARGLVAGGAKLAARLAASPLPVVIGCGGHALAMGALLLLGADVRIGAAGEFKLGLNEVAIQMTLPGFAVELANERLSRRHLLRATTLAELYDPVGACDAGYLDRVVPAEQLEAEALAEAARLAELPRRAFAATKLALRGAMVERIRSSIEQDLAGWRVG
jgi:enoyl-CoA hydratase/carnithine racemase